MWSHLYFYFVKDTDKPSEFCEGNVLIYYYWKPFGLSFKIKMLEFWTVELLPYALL